MKILILSSSHSESFVKCQHLPRDKEKIVSNLLLIDLGPLPNISGIKNLANAAKNKDPFVSISLLIYQEFEPLVQLIENITYIYTIDREKIISIKSSNLFSDTFAFNHFYNTDTKNQKNKMEKCYQYQC